MNTTSRIAHSVPIETYHADTSTISKTGLDDIHRSPAHYYALHLDPTRPPRAVKAGQLEGSLAHCALLEPSAFDERYRIGPDLNRNTKAWKEERDDAVKLGLVLIKPAQYDTAWRQADAMRALPQVRDALIRGAPEVSAYWTDATMGIACRCRPDWVEPVNENDVILLDVKTTSDASPRAFQVTAARKRYHVQAAFYSDGYERATGLRVLAFVFVAVEGTWPFAANAMLLDDEALQLGRDEYHVDLAVYAQCERANVWPGYNAGEIGLISLPRFAFYSDNNDDEPHHEGD